MWYAFRFFFNIGEFLPRLGLPPLSRRRRVGVCLSWPVAKRGIFMAVMTRIPLAPRRHRRRTITRKWPPHHFLKDGRTDGRTDGGHHICPAARRLLLQPSVWPGSLHRGVDSIFECADLLCCGTPFSPLQDPITQSALLWALQCRHHPLP